MNLLHLLDAGNGYIVSKSLLKSTKKEQEWTYNDEGYTVVSPDFKYKSRIMKRKVKDENGNEREIEEKVVVYWSRKFEARSIQENKNFLDFLSCKENFPKFLMFTFPPFEHTSKMASFSSFKKLSQLFFGMFVLLESSLTNSVLFI